MAKEKEVSWEDIERKVKGAVKKIVIMYLLEPASMYSVQKRLREAKIIESERAGYKALYELINAGLVKVSKEERRRGRTVKIVETDKRLIASAFAKDVGIDEDIVYQALQHTTKLFSQLTDGIKLSRDDWLKLIRLITYVELDLAMAGLIAIYVFSKEANIDSKKQREITEKLSEYLREKYELKPEVLGRLLLSFEDFLKKVQVGKGD